MTDEQVIARLKERGSRYFDGIMWQQDEFAVETLKVITRQQAALAECHKEIFKLREAMLAVPSGAV